MPVPKSRVEYPEGVCVKTEKGYYYIGKKFRYSIKSQRVLESWRFNVLGSSEAAVKHYTVSSKPLGFRAGTLIKNIADGKIYVISQNLRRQVTSPDILVSYGYLESQAIVVSEEEANLHDNGEVLK
jgi:hypothetical protein